LNHVSEIDQATFETVRELIVRAELQSVRLAKCKVSTKPRAAASDESHVAFALTTKAEGRRDGEKLRCEFSFALNATHENPDSKPMEILLTLEATYKVPIEITFSAKQVKAFATTNGMLNVWPYWREFVQSVTSRAGLPPLTLPLFRVHIMPTVSSTTEPPKP
jgi:preprotein translocase subunit SecB